MTNYNLLISKDFALSSSSGLKTLSSALWCYQYFLSFLPWFQRYIFSRNKQFVIRKYCERENIPNSGCSPFYVTNFNLFIHNSPPIFNHLKLYKSALCFIVHVSSDVGMVNPGINEIVLTKGLKKWKHWNKPNYWIWLNC